MKNNFPIISERRITMKRLFFITVALLMVFSLIPAAFGAFEDEPAADHWVYENFQKVNDAGLLKGYPDGTFKGERPATRYEMVEMVARLLDYFQDKIGQTDTDGNGVVCLDEEQVKAIIAESNSEMVDEIYTAIENLEIALQEDLAALDVRVTTLEEEVELLKQRDEELAKKDAELAQKDAELDQKIQKNKKMNILSIILGIIGCFLP